MTLRLSSACSNQLSYAPASAEASAGKPIGWAGSFAAVPNPFRDEGEWSRRESNS